MELPEEAEQAPKQQREKVELAKREKLDTEKLRMEKLARENGVSVEEFAKLRSKSSKLPPRPKPAKVGKQQVKTIPRAGPYHLCERTAQHPASSVAERGAASSHAAAAQGSNGRGTAAESRPG